MIALFVCFRALCFASLLRPHDHVTHFYVAGDLERAIDPEDSFWERCRDDSSSNGVVGVVMYLSKLNVELYQQNAPRHSDTWWPRLFTTHTELAWDDYEKDYSDLPQDIMKVRTHVGGWVGFVACFETLRGCSSHFNARCKRLEGRRRAILFNLITAPRGMQSQAEWILQAFTALKTKAWSTFAMWILAQAVTAGLRQ